MERELMGKNEQFRDELIEYIESLGSWYNVCIYCNGHLYTSDVGPGRKRCETENGTVYYDAGEKDVRGQLEYCNPDSITMTFEGPFYDDVNEMESVGNKLNEIGEKYGVYYEQGHAWNLAFYEL